MQGNENFVFGARTIEHQDPPDSANSLCTGSIDMPRDTDFFNTSKWEQAFFGSFFTHPNVHEAGRLIKEGSCYRFWLDMLDGKYKTFPAHQLVDSKTTLADVLTQLKKG